MAGFGTGALSSSFNASAGLPRTVCNQAVNGDVDKVGQEDLSMPRRVDDSLRQVEGIWDILLYSCGDFFAEWIYYCTTVEFWVDERPATWHRL